jgi:hypothetical protein
MSQELRPRAMTFSKVSRPRSRPSQTELSSSAIEDQDLGLEIATLLKCWVKCSLQVLADIGITCRLQNFAKECIAIQISN